MRKVALGFLGLFMASFAVVVIIILLNQHGVLNLSDGATEYFKTFQKVFTTIAILFALIYWVVAFINDGFTKYRLHDIAGIVGSAMFMVAFVAMALGTNASYLFIVGGLFCLYCVLIPLITITSEKFSNKKWEPALVWGVIGSISIYGMSTFSNIIINEIFGVDASYFTQTKPIAMLLVATPITALISFACVLISIVPFLRNNKELSFYSINGFFASYAILLLSLAYGSNISSLLEKTAAIVDFNSNYPCILSDDIKSVIFLDPYFKNVLAYNPSSDKKYVIQRCVISSNTQYDESDH